jgi:hypothetical protein
MRDYIAITSVAGDVISNSIASTSRQSHVFVILIVDMCGFLPVVSLVRLTL